MDEQGPRDGRTEPRRDHASRGTGRHVLIAEDQFIGVLHLTRLLEANGDRVTSMGRGADAIEAAASLGPDAILMDVELPDMDGCAAATRIRADETRSGRRVPIIAVTGHATEDVRERCLAAGMDACLAKPIDAAALLRTIARLTGAPTPALASSPPADPGAVLDHDRLHAETGGSAALVEELATVFADEFARISAAIAAALDANDSERLARAAHDLKGAVGSLSGRAAHVAAERLEAVAREGDMHRARTACVQVDREVERFRAALAAVTRGAA
jgi:CheY-like chemotaxis protein